MGRLILQRSEREIVRRPRRVSRFVSRGSIPESPVVGIISPLNARKRTCKLLKRSRWLKQIAILTASRFWLTSFASMTSHLALPGGKLDILNMVNDEGFNVDP